MTTRRPKPRRQKSHTACCTIIVYMGLILVLSRSGLLERSDAISMVLPVAAWWLWYSLCDPSIMQLAKSLKRFVQFGLQFSEQGRFIGRELYRFATTQNHAELYEIAQRCGVVFASVRHERDWVAAVSEIAEEAIALEEQAKGLWLKRWLRAWFLGRVAWLLLDVWTATPVNYMRGHGRKAMLAFRRLRP